MNKNTPAVFIGLNKQFNPSTVSMQHDLKPSVARDCLQDLLELDLIRVVDRGPFDGTFEVKFEQNFDCKNPLGIAFENLWNDESDAKN